MSDIRKYAVTRWDPTYKNCLSIVLPNSSLLLQANNAYTRDQWYHSILWKVNSCTILPFYFLQILLVFSSFDLSTYVISLEIRDI